jgi:hypothetical protein
MSLYVATVVLLIVVLNASGIVMQVRVNRILEEPERFSWVGRRNSIAVSRKYRELFPDSYLPKIARYSSWLIAALIPTGIAVDLWKSK